VFSFGDKKDQGVAQTLVPDRALRKVEELCAIRRTNVTNRASVSTGDHNRIEKGYSFVTAATRGVKFASAASCCWGSMSASGPKQTSLVASHMSAFGGKADKHRWPEIVSGHGFTISKAILISRLISICNPGSANARCKTARRMRFCSGGFALLTP
jgi:hypothetical protein